MPWERLWHAAIFRWHCMTRKVAQSRWAMWRRRIVNSWLPMRDRFIERLASLCRASTFFTFLKSPTVYTRRGRLFIIYSQNDFHTSRERSVCCHRVRRRSGAPIYYILWTSMQVLILLNHCHSSYQSISRTCLCSGTIRYDTIVGI